MGRKRVPVEVRKLTGARVRPEHEVDDAVRPKAGRPPMPKFLDPEARKEWLRMVGLLLEMNALAKTHRAALALYCVSWGNVADLAGKLTAEKAAAVAAGGAAGDALIARRPSGLERISATLQALHEAMAACQRHLSELGLSPTAQARILATRPDTAGQLDLPGLSDPVADKLAKLQVVQGGRS
jgi:P27 family predicted phage terminase small subunit